MKPPPPAVLSDRGRELRTSLCDEFDRHSASCCDGTHKLQFNSSIYGHPDVVAALTVAQHRKCCFCEKKSLGDIEHFRPKGGYRQSLDDPLERPGYYWLTYEWSNLFIACGPCNQRFKRNLFPLRDPAHRAKSHHDDIDLEEPLLLNPTADDPESHIAFREEVAYPLNDSVRGKATIEILNLNREDLVESRRGVLAAMQNLHSTQLILQRFLSDISDSGWELPQELRAQFETNEAKLQRARSDESEYSSMARCALR